MAQCTLCLDHPYFQEQVGHIQSPDFNAGLLAAKAKIEANHLSCNQVVQQMPGYPDCQNKIWKYDWAPENEPAFTRKGWRMVAIVPEPTVQPYRLIAAAVYEKGATTQLSIKQLRQIFLKITGRDQTVRQEVEPPPQEQGGFQRISHHNGHIISVCRSCGENFGPSPDEAAIVDGENNHQCPGPIF